MTIREEPARLLAEGSGASPGTRRLLASAAADAPGAEALAGLDARMASLLDPPAGGPGRDASATGPAAATSGTSKATAVLVAAVLGAATGAVVLWMTRGEPERASPQPVVAPQDPIARPAPPAPVAHPPPAPTPPPVSAEPPRATSQAPAVRRPPPVTRADEVPEVEPADAPEQPVPDESALLNRAHQALRDGRAGDALAAVAEHERLHRAGALVEEREAIAVEALHRLGRTDAARLRLDRLIADYPRSGYRWRLEELLR